MLEYGNVRMPQPAIPIISTALVRHTKAHLLITLGAIGDVLGRAVVSHLLLSWKYAIRFIGIVFASDALKERLIWASAWLSAALSGASTPRRAGQISTLQSQENQNNHNIVKCVRNEPLYIFLVLGPNTTQQE
eukprot:27221-Pleurochrysis_carterae.AAC.2